MSNKPDVAHSPATAVGTAVLAVLAAIGTLVDDRTAAQALAAKNTAILFSTAVNRSNNAYESRLIGAQIYEAARVSSSSIDPRARERLAKLAAGELSAARPFLERAKRDQEAATDANERSGRFTETHDYYDGAVTLVEIAIAIVSISALASSLYLVGFGGLCATVGVALFLYATLRG